MAKYDDLSERTREINEFVDTVSAIGALLEDLDDSPRVAHFTSIDAAHIGRLLRRESERVGGYIGDLIAEEYEALEAEAPA